MQPFDFQIVQSQLTDFIRDPENQSGPDGMEERRLKVYADLFSKNIEGFLSYAFATLKAACDEQHWADLVRGFIRDHVCRTPYFREISREFLIYLLYEYPQKPGDPPWIYEFVHFRWLWLELETAEPELPDTQNPVEFAEPDFFLDLQLDLSPLLCSVYYNYPIHQINSENTDVQPSPTPNYLLLWRNRSDQVRLMESNQVTARLLELIGNPDLDFSIRQCLQQIGIELNSSGEALQSVIENGSQVVAKLIDNDILIGCR